jgi:transcriptional regulator with XRE-family HTH domain
MAEPTRTVGDYIRNARVAVRLTLKDLALESGISRRTLTRWEYNDVVPDRGGRAKVIEALLRYDDAVGRRLAAEVGVEVLERPSQKAAPTIDPLDVLETASVLAADALDVAPRKVRTAFAQLVLQLQGAGLSLEDLARALTRPAPDRKRNGPR